MRVLTTFPGKFGDLLWALPTIRAVSRRIGEPVDLLIAAPFVSICPLLESQPYIGRCRADESWQVQETAPMTPRTPLREDVISPYAAVLHLGYRAWPQRPLPFETLDCYNYQQRLGYQRLIADADLHLEEPWITAGARPNFVPFNPRLNVRIAVGFTDEHFELKYGLTQLIDAANNQWDVTPIGQSPRWDTEGCGGGCMNWAESTAALQAARVFLGCCSALHVLAVAVGTPVVLMEPSPARHNPVFYPLGQDGPQVTLVRGGDGQPTWDSRHVRETLKRVLTQPLLRR